VFVKQFRTGGDRNFGYLVADETKKKAAIIDPSYSPEMIVEFARGRDYEIEYVFSTHDHFDHQHP
jgi:glyoxylase-like metal-dependent hydrolase (beta-lactamase superfamily II)